MMDFRKAVKPSFAFMNAGGIRAGITAGPITVGEVLTILPFGNAVVDIKLTGAAIRTGILAALNKFHPGNNKAVTSGAQFSGLKIKATKGADGKYAKLDSAEILVNGAYAALDDATTYAGVTIDFLATGGDNIFGGPIAGASPALDTLDVVVQNYIKAHTPISPKLDGRLTLA
ncbi:5'-nucleotidase [Ramicandelaber brevisporus]|nr:5'-nucleotidase [Ramicandelaber brevisporus]KAI8866327.1 5'-nucleotidase [Ramicandelaber brevisporus]